MTTRSQAITSTTDASRGAALGVGALLIGATGALFGLLAFLAVVLGDDAVAFDVASLIAGGFVALGIVSVGLVRDAPGPAAVGMATVTIADVILLGDEFGPWWTAYQRAVGTSGAAETAFWAGMPAMGLFAVSALLFAFGAMLAALRWDATTPQPNSSLEGLP